MIAWLLTNPKTVASIILAIALMAVTGYVVFRWEDTKAQLITAKAAVAEREHTISDLQRNAAVLQSAKDASDTALKDLAAAHDQADAAARAAQAQLDQLQASNEELQRSLINAPVADKACMPIALSRLFDNVYPRAAAASRVGGRAGSGGGQGSGAGGVLREGDPVARGTVQPARPVVTITPAH